MAESIRVVCRIRPLNKIEKSKNSGVCVSFPGPNYIAVGGKTYGFDAVLNQVSQEVAFDVIGRPIVDSVINGYNGTIFVYGQTSSGKTHTMEGDLKSPENMGIIPRILDEIFMRITSMEGNIEFLIKVSYMELYMEKIKDLFDPEKDNLPVNEDKNHVPYVKGLTERFVGSYDDAISALEEGKMNRHVSFTNMNAQSSRSHSLFIVQISQRNVDTGQALDGRLNLVDLAGSEKVSKTGAEGNTLDEAKMINKSLSTLGNVINALVEGSNHIPYRDSKLTRILQQSLGGNAKTTMVICCSPAEYNEAETKSTILFGTRAKRIKNQAKCNVQLSAEQWQRMYEKEAEKVKRFQAIIAGLEEEAKKWRAGQKVPQEEWFTPDKYGAAAKVETASEAAPSSAPPPPPPPRPDDIASVKSDTGPSEGPKTDEQKLKSLYREMDKKDEQVAQITQEKNALKTKYENLKSERSKLKDECQTCSKQLSSIQKEVEDKAAELKDVINALEDLAMKYDQKCSALDARTKELDDLTAEYETLKKKADSKKTVEAEVHKATNEVKTKISESLKELIKELYDFGVLITPSLKKSDWKKAKQVDDQLAYLKFLVAQLTAATEKSTELGQFLQGGGKRKDRPSEPTDPTAGRGMDTEAVKKEIERQVKEMKVHLSEAEQRVQRISDEKGKLLEELEQVNKEHMALKQSKQLASQMEAAKKKDPDLYDRVISSANRSASHYQGQMDRLRADLDDARNAAERMREQNLVLKLQMDSVMLDVEAMKKRFVGDGKTDPVAAVKEKAKSDIKPLEDSIMTDLQTLHNLRKMFIVDLRGRIKKAMATPPEKPSRSSSCKFSSRQTSDFLAEHDEDEDGSEGTLQQREKIEFLTHTLHELTSANKSLQRDNADLQCELPRLEKRLNATFDRINELEDTLRDFKEKAVLEKQRYKTELDRLKENMLGGTKRGVNIAKPIRAGAAK